VNSDDYFLIDRAFSGQGAPLATAAGAQTPMNAPAASAEAVAIDSAVAAPVMAPSSLTVAAQPITITKTRRKRHHFRHEVPDPKLWA
jgi:hypothetical protein